MSRAIGRREGQALVTTTQVCLKTVNPHSTVCLIFLSFLVRLINCFPSHSHPSLELRGPSPIRLCRFYLAISASFCSFLCFPLFLCVGFFTLLPLLFFSSSLLVFSSVALSLFFISLNPISHLSLDPIYLACSVAPLRVNLFTWLKIPWRVRSHLPSTSPILLVCSPRRGGKKANGDQ